MIATRRWLIIALGFLFLSGISFECNGQKRTKTVVNVHANQLYQQTQITVTKEETYKLTAEGEWQDADFPPSDTIRFLKALPLPCSLACC